MPRDQLSFPTNPEPVQRNLDFAATNDLELLRYCRLCSAELSVCSLLTNTVESTVIYLLPMLHTDRARLCQLLLRVAISYETKASRAVYHAILALSSYHQGGDLLYVDQLKRTALRELWTDTVPTECEGLCHIAANLLLCVLEVWIPNSLRRPTLTLTDATNGRQQFWLGRIYQWSQAGHRCCQEGTQPRWKRG